MALFAIADLHLSTKVDKPMDVFGGIWKDYQNKLIDSWNKAVSEEDTVVIPGDISWATYMEDADEDFKLLDKLPGNKIILKGNHDYWFETANKLNLFFEKHEIKTIKLLHNSFFSWEDIAICGTKGADMSKIPTTDNAKLIENRERIRLENSLLKAEAAGFERKYVFLHYPPLLRGGKYNDNPFTKLMQEHKVEKCFYGHLHSRSHNVAICEQFSGTEYRLISADFINFTPFLINSKKSMEI